MPKSATQCVVPKITLLAFIMNKAWNGKESFFPSQRVSKKGKNPSENLDDTSKVELKKIIWMLTNKMLDIPEITFSDQQASKQHKDCSEKLGDSQKL